MCRKKFLTFSPGPGDFQSSNSQLLPPSPEATQKKPMGPPATRNGQSSINDILNASSPPQLEIDTVRLDDLKHRLASDTHGLSVEQLEQINASLMHTIWMNRSNWNRTRVTKDVLDAFERLLVDVGFSTVQQIQDPIDEAGFDALAHSSQAY